MEMETEMEMEIIHSSLSLAVAAVVAHGAIVPSKLQSPLNSATILYK